jgi:hypothetical protein
VCFGALSLIYFGLTQEYLFLVRSNVPRDCNKVELALFATVLGVLWLNGNADGRSTFLLLPQLLNWFLLSCLAVVLLSNFLRTLNA